MNRRGFLAWLAAVPVVGRWFVPRQTPTQKWSVKYETGRAPKKIEWRTSLVYMHFSTAPTDANGRDLTADEIRDQYGIDSSVVIDLPKGTPSGRPGTARGPERQ